MKRDEVIRILRENDAALRERHVRHLAVFGSTARDEAADSSDVDLLVEFHRTIGLFHLFRTQHFIEDLLGVERVDLIQRSAIPPAFRDEILREAIDVA